MAHKHPAGDGHEGGQPEENVSASVEGIFVRRLAPTESDKSSFGFGEHVRTTPGASPVATARIRALERGSKFRWTGSGRAGSA